MKNGEWVLTHDFDDNEDAMSPLGRVVRCSECGYPENRIATRYCPSCGSEMKNSSLRDSEDTCVCCGEIIPEGRMVCPNCLVAVKGSEDED